MVPAGAAGQWVEAPGAGWIQASLYHHDTREEFGIDRARMPIRNGGHAVATSLYVTGAFGVVPGLDVWAQVPVHRIEYDDFAGARDRSGPGDGRFFLRAAPLRWLGSSFPLAVRGGVKLQIGNFPLDAEIIALGEGQRDWELIGEVGHSFYPRPVYLMAWLGYRWREADTELRRDFGDETFFLAALGGSAGRAQWKLTVEGWDGAAPLIEGIRLENASREMLQVTPAAGWQVGDGALEVGVRVPLAGRNLPAGPAITVGYFLRLGSS